MKIKTKIRDEDLHPHIRMRMLQRGVTKEEIEETLTKGWEAEDKFMLLTVIAKYGENFPKNEEEKCG
jgi:SOS response regulatory protein OraA/RecX